VDVRTAPSGHTSIETALLIESSDGASGGGLDKLAAAGFVS